MATVSLGLGLGDSGGGGAALQAPRRGGGANSGETPAAPASARWAGSPDKGSRNKLNTRVGHPVQGTPCTPYVHTRDAAGKALPDDAVSFAWYRSTSFRHCAFAGCPRGAIELAAPPKLQCTGCLDAGMPEEFSYFCSPECFKGGAPAYAHAAFALAADGEEASSGEGAVARGGPAADAEKKEVLLGPTTRYAPAPFKGGVKRPGAGIAAAGTTLPPTSTGASPEWTLVSTSRSYTPRAPDVWHKLRVVVCANWGGSGGEEMKRLDTEWVSPAPPPHPPRPLTFRSCPAVGITAATLAGAQAEQAALMPTDRSSRMRAAGQAPPGQVAHAPPPRLTPAVVRVVSYNTLAEIYATKSQYPYAPLWVLDWNYRRLLLVAELRRLDADVLCLQEVQADHFDSFLCPALKSLGYAGLYKQKTRDSMGKAGRVDGCAMFYKTDRFRLKAKHVVEFNEAAANMYSNSGGGATVTAGGGVSTPVKPRSSARSGISSPAPEMGEPATGSAYAPNSKQSILAGVAGEGRAALQRLLRDNVAQVVRLQVLTNADGSPAARGAAAPELLVCNTHLFWDPEFGDVKLWQTHMLAQELESFSAASGTPLVLCGDFNSQPDTAVPKLLGRNTATGHLHSLLKTEDLPHDPAGVLPARENLKHGLMLASAYASVLGSDPDFTNFTQGYQGTLDYIWFTTDTLAPVAVLEIPGEASLKEYSSKPLPNEQWPSDHLCLCTDFIILPPSARAPRAPSAPSAQAARSHAPGAGEGIAILPPARSGARGREMPPGTTGGVPGMLDMLAMGGGMTSGGMVGPGHMQGMMHTSAGMHMASGPGMPGMGARSHSGPAGMPLPGGGGHMASGPMQAALLRSSSASTGVAHHMAPGGSWAGQPMHMPQGSEGWAAQQQRMGGGGQFNPPTSAGYSAGMQLPGGFLKQQGGR